VRRNEILILLHARILSFTCKSGPFADRRGVVRPLRPPWLRACLAELFWCHIILQKSSKTVKIKFQIQFFCEKQPLMEKFQMQLRNNSWFTYLLEPRFLGPPALWPWCLYWLQPPAEFHRNPSSFTVDIYKPASNNHYNISRHQAYRLLTNNLRWRQSTPHRPTLWLKKQVNSSQWESLEAG